MREIGWKNAYTEPPKEADEYWVEDHAKNRFKAKYYINELGSWVWKGGKSGYDICWWKKCSKLVEHLKEG